MTHRERHFVGSAERGDNGFKLDVRIGHVGVFYLNIFAFAVGVAVVSAHNVVFSDAEVHFYRAVVAGCAGLNKLRCACLVDLDPAASEEFLFPVLFYVAAGDQNAVVFDVTADGLIAFFSGAPDSLGSVDHLGSAVLDIDGRGIADDLLDLCAGKAVVDRPDHSGNAGDMRRRHRGSLPAGQIVGLSRFGKTGARNSLAGRHNVEPFALVAESGSLINVLPPEETDVLVLHKLRRADNDNAVFQILVVDV